MSTSRLESFSDGVIAVIITIMVLELHTPSSPSLTALLSGAPTFIAYMISFSIIGTYWNNHHHLIRLARDVTPKLMWSNLFFLFWLSLIPFMTSWLGEFYTSLWPTVCYAILLTICALSYLLLQSNIIEKGFGRNAVGGIDPKGVVSLLGYILSIGLGFVSHWFADILFVVFAIVWFIPRRSVTVE